MDYKVHHEYYSEPNIHVTTTTYRDADCNVMLRYRDTWKNIKQSADSV